MLILDDIIIQEYKYAICIFSLPRPLEAQEEAWHWLAFWPEPLALKRMFF